MKIHPRVPLPATVDLVDTEHVFQVNHFRAPNCKNFGIPTRPPLTAGGNNETDYTIWTGSQKNENELNALLREAFNALA